MTAWPDTGNGQSEISGYHWQGIWLVVLLTVLMHIRVPVKTGGLSSLCAKLTKTESRTCGQEVCGLRAGTAFRHLFPYAHLQYP